MEHLITVAVPTCNGESHLSETLLSILSQKGADFELIISDDNSDDRTLDLVRATAGDRAHVVVNRERLGLAGNWNQCVRLCSTPYIAIVHQDDVLCPGHLAAHVSAFNKDERVGLVASNKTTIDAQGREIPDPATLSGLGPIDRVYYPGEVAEQMVVRDNPFRCSAVSIRTEAHAEVGGFTSKYRYVLDWDFWLRVSRSWKVAWLASPSVKIRSHDESETTRLYSKHEKDLTLLKEHESLIDEILKKDLAGHPQRAKLLREVNLRLARTLLNNSLFKLWAGQPDLAKECLLRAVRRSPRILGSIMSQYRIGVKMGILALAPSLAGHLFSRAEASE
jgi:glycosyltransferase involved in cell wall biosynthesis